MYGFNINKDAGPMVITCGLDKPVEVANLGEAYDVFVRATPDTIERGTPKVDWRGRVLAEGDLDVSLQAYRGEFLVKVSEAYSGSETTTGASTLAEVFDFIDYWAGGCFE